MTDFRALCVELIESVLSDNSHIDCMDIARRARAALAEEPATWTEGLCGDGAALLKDGVMVPIETVVRELNEGARARAVLARWGNPAPQPAAKGEVAELVNALKGIAYWRRHNKPRGPAPAPFDIRQADRLDRAADLLQRLSPPQPVPGQEVSE